MNFDIVIRTILQGAGLQATDAQVKQLTQDVERLNSVASKSTFGDVFGGSAVGSFLGGYAQGALLQATAQIKQFALQSIDLADKLDDLAGKSGVSAEALQVIGNAASTGTGSIESVAAAFAFLNRSSAAARGGSDEMAAAFKRLNVSVEDLRSKSPEQIMMQIADATATTKDRSQAYADVLAVLGRDAGNLFSTLETGSEKIDQLGRSMGVFSDVSRQQLAAAKDELQKLNNQAIVFTGNMAGAALVGAKEFGNLGTVVAMFADGPLLALHHAFKLGENAAKEAKKAIADAAGAKDGKPPVVDTVAGLEEHMAGLAEEWRAAGEAEQRQAEARAKAAMAAMQKEIARGEQMREMKQLAEDEIAVLELRLQGQDSLAEKKQIELETERQIARLRGEGPMDPAVEAALRKGAALKQASIDQRDQAKAAKDAADEAEREARARRQAADEAERAKRAMEDFSPSVGEEAGMSGSRGARARRAARERTEREARRTGQDAGLQGEQLDNFVKNQRRAYDQALRDKQGRGGSAIGGPTPIVTDNQPAVPKPVPDAKSPAWNAPWDGGKMGQAGQGMDAAAASVNAAAGSVQNGMQALDNLAAVLQQLAEKFPALASAVAAIQATLKAFETKLGK